MDDILDTEFVEPEVQVETFSDSVNVAAATSNSGNGGGYWNPWV